MHYRIRDRKDKFIASLLNLYPAEEINAFFRILIEEYAGISLLNLMLDPDRTLDSIIYQKIENAIERLKQSEPIQYILGKTWFYDLEYIVTPDVLIPRPETELLADLIIKDLLKENEQRTTNNEQLSTINDQRFLDIGTGSGCIAISLKHNLPKAYVTGIDISEKALNIARQNAEKNNADVNFLLIDILNSDSYNKLQTTNYELQTPYDLIVSNPPYVRESEKQLMKPNVTEFEPHLALFVNDDDALLFYRAIADFCLAGHLKNKGKLYLEINEGLANELVELFKLKGFININIIKDLNDKDRILSCMLIN